MKVFFDHQVFALQNYGGASKYFIKLIENFSKEIDPRVISLFYKSNLLKTLKKKESIIKTGKNLNYLDFIFKVFNQKYFQFRLNNFDPNILHYTYFNERKIYKTKAKTIITEFDLIKEKMLNKDFLEQIKFKKKLYQNIDFIICISNNTKKDLIDIYNIDEKKISTIHLGVEQNNNFNQIKIKPKPFLLYVGRRDGYKNFNNLVKAYNNSEKIKSNFNIVCFGGGEFTKKEKKLFNELKLNHNILHYTGNDLDLNFFYKQARIFIYPSLYEGFGLPLLEAMNMSCAVACSNASCFPEICNDSAFYFDPNDIESIKNQLEKTLFDDQLLSEMKIKGKNLIKNFSWQKCAYKTEEVYKSIL